MNKLRFAIIGVGFLCAAAHAAEPAPASGVDLQYLDENVRAQDDFYRHVNGRWLATTEIPADKPAYSSFDVVFDVAQVELHGIIEELQKSADPADADQRKIADLYASFMDEAALERLGLQPLQAEFAEIEALRSTAQIPAMIAHLNRIGVTAPFTPQVHQDAKDSTKYVFDLGQDGLGMPDRDYYLEDQAELKKTRGLYAGHVKKMLTLAGDVRAEQDATDIVALETALAKVQWTKVENRDPIKTYNKVEFRNLRKLAPGFDWQAYLADSGVAGKTQYLIVSQPSYIGALDRLVRGTPLPVWKAYFRWRVLSDFAPYLNKPFVDESFAFRGTALRGTERDRERWKRGVSLVDLSIGEGLGRLYVAKFFPPEAKARTQQLVGNLLAAYAADLQTLDWMSPETRLKAQQKLAKFTTKLGYPDKWRDYTALRIASGDLLGNVMRAHQFEYDRNLNKLGRPIDRGEWDMTPQTVNAYYNPEQNEIVFPAAILQPPYFNVRADDAVNYGAIGAIIGHEISHGFDDEGSQYDGDGNLLNPPGWFTQADFDRFKAKTRALIAQYSAHAPVPGYPINGELTLGENIADNSGLAIAYKAYQLSLGGQPAPIIDGLTGPQRFFIGFTQEWRGKTRDSQAILWIKSDPHSPDEFRGQLTEMNQDPFYEAFGVKPGDKMYVPPEQRVRIW